MWPRYLLLDAKDASQVDEEWDIPRPPIDDETSRGGIIGPYRPHLKGLPKVYIYSGRKVSRQIDFELLKSWMQDCEDNNGCYAHSEVTPSRLRVIDVYKGSVVKATPGCRYVALGYVWGSNNIGNTVKDLPAKLPQTIEDAIIAVKELGESYLWVDALRIAQDDPDDKMAQIQDMDQIYSNAVVTFVAGEGSDSNAGLLGVRPNTRSYQQYAEVVDGLTIYVSTPLLKESISPLGNLNRQNASSLALSTGRWSTRGWTFQEGLLSTRCLIFTANQVFWKCLREFCCEPIAEALDHQRQGMDTLKNSEVFASRSLTRVNQEAGFLWEQTAITSN